jgi:hypothetical protein
MYLDPLRVLVWIVAPVIVWGGLAAGILLSLNG